MQRTPAPVVADHVSVPRSLVETNRIITLAADVFFCGWDTISDNSGAAYEVCYCRERASENGGKPQETQHASVRGVQTSRVRSKNYFNGRGV